MSKSNFIGPASLLDEEFDTLPSSFELAEGLPHGHFNMDSSTCRSYTTWQNRHEAYRRHCGLKAQPNLAIFNPNIKELSPPEVTKNLAESLAKLPNHTPVSDLEARRLRALASSSLTHADILRRKRDDSTLAYEWHYYNTLLQLEQKNNA